jgi:hypothetical protein
MTDRYIKEIREKLKFEDTFGFCSIDIICKRQRCQKKVHKFLSSDIASTELDPNWRLK